MGNEKPIGMTYLEGQVGEDYCEKIYHNDWYETVSKGGNSTDFDIMFQHIVTKLIKTVEGKYQVEMMEYGSISLEVADASTLYAQKGYRPIILPDGTPAFATGLLASEADEYFFTDGISWFIVPKSVLLTHYNVNKQHVHHFARTNTAYGYTISIDELKQMSIACYQHHTPATKVWMKENKDVLLNMLNNLIP